MDLCCIAVTYSDWYLHIQAVSSKVLGVVAMGQAKLKLLEVEVVSYWRFKEKNSLSLALRGST